jgi:hypothetical protein
MSTRALPAILLVVHLLPCTGHATTDATHPSWVAIPDTLREHAVRTVSSFVGPAFFHAFFEYDPEDSRCRDPQSLRRCTVVFRFRDPDKPWMDMKVRVPVGADGHVDTLRIPFPNCAKHPEKCRFGVSKDDALAIASESGLPAGIRPWRVNLRWNTRVIDGLVWSITTITSESADETVGQELIIDVNDGQARVTIPWTLVSPP